jgi:tRNA(fMet)-specific endonuclease VapC
MIYLLDTDHLSLLERGTTEGATIRARLALLGPDDYGITIVSYGENMRGALAEVADAKTPDQETRAFRLLRENLRFCSAFAIWDYTPQAAALCAELRKQKVRIGTQDLRIASVALSTGATLLTRNARDFSKVPSLRFEDWTVSP